jgi:hypothetical protein
MEEGIELLQAPLNLPACVGIPDPYPDRVGFQVLCLSIDIHRFSILAQRKRRKQQAGVIACLHGVHTAVAQADAGHVGDTGFAGACDGVDDATIS